MTETPPPCGTTPQSDFDSQYRRVLEAAACKTQVDLAAVLGVRQSSISDARRRRSVPSDWLMKLFEKKRINPEWVRLGTGVKHLTPVDAEQGKPHVVRVMEIRPPHECSAQELFNELVRRAVQEPDIEEIQKEVAASWYPVKKLEDES